ncbi:MAG: biotin-dependent carboxyltransferase family protein [Limisphaerales bacterium]
MTQAVLEILETGPGLSFQDLGRRGWKRFGVPPGGALDTHAAQWANLLAGNPPHTPVLEILFLGARFRVLTRLSFAITGAAVGGPGQRWRTHVLDTEEILQIPPPASGVWTYLACAGGFHAPRWFGSVSLFPRGGVGQALARGDVLHAHLPPTQASGSPIGTRWVDPTEIPDYRNPPALRVWRGPQWESFGAITRTAFFDGVWEVSSRSDRTGYRLTGIALAVPPVGIPSEPVIPGSIQIPPDGQPIVTMRDGPTVGGYPKLGVVDPDDLSRLVQCRPGQSIRFRTAD